MNTPFLLNDLVTASCAVRQDAVAIVDGGQQVSYADLNRMIGQCAAGLAALDIHRNDRVAIWLEKRVETVVASFAASALGGAFVPVNPVLKAAQVCHVLRDSGAKVLITSHARLSGLSAELSACPSVRFIVVVDPVDAPALVVTPTPIPWSVVLDNAPLGRAIGCDSDMAAIFYTSGSTGKPKGVVVSHRNLVVGAQSVVTYLGNNADDVLLAALPLSFDAGFSQLTTGFLAGARIVLLNYLLPRDVMLAMARERVTGLTGVPPLFAQLARSEWPVESTEHLRYLASTGGRMPRATLNRLRELAPRAQPVLMYGLTEAFRSTWLPPEELDRRPGSIGKAIPNAEVLVLRPDGTPCAPHEHGELVHRGALVSLGYWGNPEATAERFKPLPSAVHGALLPIPEIAVFSGDTAYVDEDGFLYFVGRTDEMIKTSGYRVSPTEVEEAIYDSGLVSECAAFGVPDDDLGQSIRVVALAHGNGTATVDDIAAHCRQVLPAFMVPGHIDLRQAPLPRNPNGKIDRIALRAEACAVMEGH